MHESLEGRLLLMSFLTSVQNPVSPRREPDTRKEVWPQLEGTFPFLAAEGTHDVSCQSALFISMTTPGITTSLSPVMTVQNSRLFLAKLDRFSPFLLLKPKPGVTLRR